MGPDADRAAEIYNMSPDDHLHKAADLSATPVDQDAHLLRQTAIQTQLLWSIAKSSGSWRPEQGGWE